MTTEAEVCEHAESPTGPSRFSCATASPGSASRSSRRRLRA